MATQPLSVRQRIIENVVWTVEQMPEVEGCYYDNPMDFAQDRLPWAYVYDFEARYEYEATQRTTSYLTIGIAIAYEFSERGEDTLLRKGNTILAKLELALMADQQRGLLPDTNQKLARNTSVRSSMIQEVAEAQMIGAVVVFIEVDYWVLSKNPYLIG